MAVLLSEGLKRLRRMRADPAWQAAHAIPRTRKQERSAAFARLREQYGFSEYSLQEVGKRLRVNWLANHLDAVLAQTLAGIVNLHFPLDELSPLNLHLRPFRGLSSEKILGRHPTFLQNFWQ